MCSGVLESPYLLLITSYSSTSIAYNHYTNIYPLLHIQFAKGQGAVGGAFILLGLCVSNLQRFSRNQMSWSPGEVRKRNKGINENDENDVYVAPVADEFVTAMIEAEKLQIPVRD